MTHWGHFISLSEELTIPFCMNECREIDHNMIELYNKLYVSMLNMTEKFVCRFCVCSDMYRQTFDGYMQSRVAINFCCA